MTGSLTAVTMTMCFHIRRPGSVAGLATPGSPGEHVLWLPCCRGARPLPPGLVLGACRRQGRPQPRMQGAPVRLQPPPHWTAGCGCARSCTRNPHASSRLPGVCRGAAGNKAGVSVTRPPRVDGAAGGQPCRQQTHRPDSITDTFVGAVPPARTAAQLLREHLTLHHPSLQPELAGPGGLTSPACRLAHLVVGESG